MACGVCADDMYVSVSTKFSTSHYQHHHHPISHPVSHSVMKSESQSVGAYRRTRAGLRGGELEERCGLLQSRQTALPHQHVQVEVRAGQRGGTDVALLQLGRVLGALGGPQAPDDLYTYRAGA